MIRSKVWSVTRAGRPARGVSIACAPGAARNLLGRLLALCMGCSSALSPLVAAATDDAPRLVVQSGQRAIFMPRLVVSPDKTLIASTGEFGRGAIDVWHVATGRLLCTLPAQLEGGGAGIMTGGAASMAFSKDGAKLATSLPKKQGLQVWDLRRCEKSKEGEVRLAEGRTSRSSTGGMLIERDGKLLVLGGDGALYAGDVFGGQALRQVAPSSHAGDILHGVDAAGRFALVSGRADGSAPVSGWLTRVTDTRTGTSEVLADAPGGTAGAPMALMAQFVPPAAAISPSGRWVARFQAGQIHVIDLTRGAVTGSLSIAPPTPDAVRTAPTASPVAPLPPARKVPTCAALGTQQARDACEELATRPQRKMDEMRAAVQRMKEQAPQVGPAAIVPPWFGFSEREDVIYIWRNPYPSAGATALRPDQRSVIDVRKLPDLALLRQVPVHDADALAPFFGATATGFAVSDDGRMLALGLQSIDMGAGRLGVVDLAALGERAELRTWKPGGGSPSGLEWTSDNRLMAAIYGQRSGATISLAPRGAGLGAMPELPPGLPARVTMPANAVALANSRGHPSAPPQDSFVSTLAQWSMNDGEVTARSVGTTSPRPARLARGGGLAAVMKLEMNAQQPEKSRSTIEIFTTTGMQRVREIDLLDDRGAPLWPGPIGGPEHFAVSADGQRIAAVSRSVSAEASRASGTRAHEGRRLTLHDALTGRQVGAELPGAGGVVEFLAPDGSSMMAGSAAGRQCVTIVDDRLVASAFGVDKGILAVFGSDPMHVVVRGAGKGISRCGNAQVKWIHLASEDAKVVQLDADATRLAVARDDSQIDIYRVEADGSTVRTGELPGQEGQQVVSMAFSPDGRLLASTQTTGGTSLWNLESNRRLARLFVFEGGTWAVVDAQGRFDTNNIEDLEHLHWVMPDDALRALPLEIFMRDFFSPGLLARLIHDEPMPPVRALGDLNRAQPVLTIASVTPSRGDPKRVDVTVDVEGRSDARGRPGGVVDVRLFREGRLVGHPERRGEALKLDQATHRASVMFRSIRLPQGAQTVGFGAYAFNTDGVKSATVRRDYRVPAADVNPKHKGKAYIIAIGVNTHDNAAFDLRYAANDARLTLDVLSQRIAAQQRHREVVPIALVSDGDRVRDATKARIRAVLAVLAGKPADRQALSGIPNAASLEAATPDDLVIVTFAGHGHAGEAGLFYLLPRDIGGAGRQMTEPMLAQSISTDELEAWLRDVDAGEMSMVIDACYSAATVEREGFKPGPMGSRGLGQLAYDKGMRILAAAQADDVAIEVDRLQHGMLTFVLIRDGIEARRADFRPQDDRIHLGEWLAYGVEGVPRLLRDVASGDRAAGRMGRGLERIGAAPRVQQPRLFDYARRGDGPVIESRR